MANLLENLGCSLFVLHPNRLRQVGNQVLFWRLLRRTGPVNREVTEQSPNSLSKRRVFLLAPLLTGPPLVLAGFSILGYQYAATILDRRFGATILFFIGFVLLKELLLRWLSIAQRKLHYQSALRRRDEARAQRAKEEALAAIEESELIAIEKEEINFEDLGEQAKRLLRACFILGAIIGVWMIWADVLPALSVVGRVNLPFNTIELVDGVAKEVPVTLLDLGVALSLLVLSVVVAKNLSGVLEIAVLQRLPLDPGVRYAITTLAKYTIVTMGLIAAFGMLGAHWSKIQWLIAALGVGVGFGLQEIVANFICGIILLLERPIRIGDIITLGDTSGVVSKIRIRATTVLNWDNQELIVPNKEFITGRLLNWTLTEKRNRIVLEVGVAYDSDVVLALKILLKTADENARVLKEPKPLATFDTFGDSSLNLVLRCYLPNLDSRLAIMSELRQAILREFEANGIVIAFPQRDVHIDMTGPLGIHMSDSMENKRTSLDKYLSRH